LEVGSKEKNKLPSHSTASLLLPADRQSNFTFTGGINSMKDPFRQGMPGRGNCQNKLPVSSCQLPEKNLSSLYQQPATLNQQPPRQFPTDNGSRFAKKMPDDTYPIFDPSRAFGSRSQRSRRKNRGCSNTPYVPTPGVGTP